MRNQITIMAMVTRIWGRQQEWIKVDPILMCQITPQRNTANLHIEHDIFLLLSLGFSIWINPALNQAEKIMIW